jgi:iron(III) transport system ATP-binding protein
MHPSLEVRNACRTFGTIKAVDGVSLTVQNGEIVALLGASGSGKSTLLRILAGLEGVDLGDVFSGGELVSSPSFLLPPEKRGLGMVFQDFALFPHLTALQNVSFGLHGRSKLQANETAQNWLAKVGLASRASYYPHQLSGGEQQRVALARALAPAPKAVLMDEPFSGLDPHLRADLQSLTLETLRSEGVAAVIVSHDTDEALAVADQVAIMDRGRVLQSGAPRNVYDAPCSLDVARALGPIWTYHCHTDTGLTHTPFGSFQTKHRGDLLLVGRPEATSLTADDHSPFTVSDVRGVGRLVTVTLTDQVGRITARVSAHHAPAIGQTMAITLMPKDAFIFPASAATSR